MREREREMRRIVAVSPFLLFGSGGWVGGGMVYELFVIKP